MAGGEPLKRTPQADPDATPSLRRFLFGLRFQPLFGFRTHPPNQPEHRFDPDTGGRAHVSDPGTMMRGWLS